MKVFKETQRFTQLWLAILLGGIFVFSFYNIFKKYNSIREGNSNEEITGLIIPAVILLLVAILFIVMKLNTRIDETGIYYQFFPFHFKMKKIEWNQLNKIYVRKYSPLMDFGGWGIRGLSRKTSKGMAFNVKGNMGIQLIFKDGGKLLLGTQLPEKAEETLRNYQYKLENTTFQEN